MVKIIPTYYFVAILSLAAFIFSFVIDNDLFFYIFREVGWVGVLHLVLSNIFILGQDLIFLTGIFDGNYSFTTDFTQSELLIWAGLLVPQAWTLALEITFILLPFILKDKNKDSINVCIYSIKNIFNKYRYWNNSFFLIDFFRQNWHCFYWALSDN